ncbi:MAG TPA: Ig-like domain-containing protein [Kiritimatiellia bacterium]|nr:Ig-like domain-containing protein [Kiritimatiellia bacterium]
MLKKASHVGWSVSSNVKALIDFGTGKCAEFQAHAAGTAKVSFEVHAEDSDGTTYYGFADCEVEIRSESAWTEDPPPQVSVSCAEEESTVGCIGSTFSIIANTNAAAGRRIRDCGYPLEEDLELDGVETRWTVGSEIDALPAAGEGQTATFVARKPGSAEVTFTIEGKTGAGPLQPGTCKCLVQVKGVKLEKEEDVVLWALGGTYEPELVDGSDEHVTWSIATVEGAPPGGFDTGSGEVTFGAAPGKYEITVTPTESGCAAKTMTLDVSDMLVEFEPNPLYICQGNTVGLTVYVTPAEFQSQVSVAVEDGDIAEISSGTLPNISVHGISSGTTKIKVMKGSRTYARLTTYVVRLSGIQGPCCVKEGSTLTQSDFTPVFTPKTPPNPPTVTVEPLEFSTVYQQESQPFHAYTYGCGDVLGSIEVVDEDQTSEITIDLEILKFAVAMDKVLKKIGSWKSISPCVPAAPSGFGLEVDVEQSRMCCSSLSPACIRDRYKVNSIASYSVVLGSLECDIPLVGIPEVLTGNAHVMIASSIDFSFTGEMSCDHPQFCGNAMSTSTGEGGVSITGLAVINVTPVTARLDITGGGDVCYDFSSKKFCGKNIEFRVQPVLSGKVIVAGHRFIEWKYCNLGNGFTIPVGVNTCE